MILTDRTTMLIQKRNGAQQTPHQVHNKLHTKATWTASGKKYLDVKLLKDLYLGAHVQTTSANKIRTVIYRITTGGCLTNIHNNSLV